MVAKFSGRVYPNGEFTVGVVPRQLKPSDILPVKSTEDPHVTEVTEALKDFGLDGALWAYGTGEDLGSSSVPILDIRAPKGLKGISSHGRRMIRNGCWMLEREFGKGRCGFGTLTLPDLTDEDYINVCKHWGEIVNRFSKWAQRRLKARGVKKYIVYVTEFQEKRYVKTRKAYPHLHLCYPARPERNYRWYLPASDIRRAWQRVVESHCVQHYNFGASVDCVVVKKSLGAYLSKYLSKGAGDIPRYLASGLPVECLGHWWGNSGELRKAIKAETRSSPAIARHIWENATELAAAGGIKWCRYITIETNLTGERIIGLCGGLAEETKLMLYCLYPKQKGNITWINKGE